MCQNKSGSLVENGYVKMDTDACPKERRIYPAATGNVSPPAAATQVSVRFAPSTASGDHRMRREDFGNAFLLAVPFSFP
jgi:hypothetical protein